MEIQLKVQKYLLIISKALIGLDLSLCQPVLAPWPHDTLALKSL